MKGGQWNPRAAGRELCEANDGADPRRVGLVPTLAEVLVDEGDIPNGDVDDARAARAWVDVHAIDEETAVTGGHIADELPPGGPCLDGLDAVIAAVGGELDAPVVSGAGDFPHEETKQVVDIEKY